MTASDTSAASEMLAKPQYIIEGIILRRLHERRIEGYTIEMAKEIAEALAAQSPAPMREALEAAQNELRDLARPICAVYNRSEKKYEFTDDHIKATLPGTFETIEKIRAALASQPEQPAEHAQEPLGWPSREVVAREIRMAMLDNPTDESFNKRAEERERIANDAADVILARFAACRTPAETEPKDVSYDLTSRANALISEACGPDQSEWTKYDHGLMNICREAYERITDLRAAKEEYFALNMRLTNELAEAKGLVECSRDDAVRDCLHEIDRLRCIPINTGHDRAAALTEAYSAVRRLRDSSKSLEATNG